MSFMCNFLQFLNCDSSHFLQFPYCDGSHSKHNEETGDNVGPLIVKKKIAAKWWRHNVTDCTLAARLIMGLWDYDFHC